MQPPTQNKPETFGPFTAGSALRIPFTLDAKGCVEMTLDNLVAAIRSPERIGAELVKDSLTENIWILVDGGATTRFTDAHYTLLWLCLISGKPAFPKKASYKRALRKALHTAVGLTPRGESGERV